MVIKVNQPRAETLVLKFLLAAELCYEEVEIAGNGTARTLEVGQVLAEFTGGADVGTYVEAAVGGLNGSATAKAVLVTNVDVPAAGNVKVRVVERLAVLDRDNLIFIGTPTAPEQQAFIDQLKPAFLFAR